MTDELSITFLAQTCEEQKNVLEEISFLKSFTIDAHNWGILNDSTLDTQVDVDA